MRTTTRYLAIAVLAFAPALAAQGAPLYRLTDLGTLGGGQSNAGAINAAGQVAGTSYIEGDHFQHAFLYSGGTMIDLGTLGGSSSFGVGIDAQGRISGSSLTIAEPERHAFVHDGASMRDLGTLGGNSSAGGGIAAGRITGWSLVDGSSTPHAFLTDGGTLVDLYAAPHAGAPFNGSFSQGIAVNAAGQVVGASDFHQALLYDGTATRALGNFGGESVATAINDAGIAVGQAAIVDPITLYTIGFHAFVWDDGMLRDLGTLGGSDSAATAINGSGWIVGTTSLAGNQQQSAFLDAGSGMMDLNTLLVGGGPPAWLYSATGINDAGQIVGDGVIDGQYHAFLLTPVDEAPASALMLAGIAALGALRRRR